MLEGFLFFWGGGDGGGLCFFFKEKHHLLAVKKTKSKSFICASTGQPQSYIKSYLSCCVKLKRSDRNLLFCRNKSHFKPENELEQNIKTFL